MNITVNKSIIITPYKLTPQNNNVKSIIPPTINLGQSNIKRGDLKANIGGHQLGLPPLLFLLFPPLKKPLTALLLCLYIFLKSFFKSSPAPLVKSSSLLITHPQNYYYNIIICM